MAHDFSQSLKCYFMYFFKSIIFQKFIALILNDFIQLMNLIFIINLLVLLIMKFIVVTKDILHNFGLSPIKQPLFFKVWNIHTYIWILLAFFFKLSIFFVRMFLAAFLSLIIYLRLIVIILLIYQAHFLRI